MEQITSPIERHSISYNIFILVLTILSLGIMIWMLLPVSEQTRRLLQFYDNLICFIFLFDFFSNLRASPKKSDYFIKERGWLDLLGSIPTFGISQYIAILRLARLSRLARITRLMRGKDREAMLKDVIENRSRYTLFITVLMTILVLTVASVLVLQFESKSANANIQTGWDSFWYSIVTITTVGYGDRYPVTTGGRITAMFIMLMGIGIIGALASILSSLLVGSTPAPAEDEKLPESSPAEIADELAAIKGELAVLRQLMEELTNQSK